MLEELPRFYEPILEMRAIVQAEGEQFDRLGAELADQFRQRFVSTATWGLGDWESELGIVPPAGQPVEQRRSVIRSKTRGFGKFSGRLLQSVAGAYDNGNLDIAFDAPSSTFTIRFASTLGLPPNLDDLKTALEAVMPSHLGVAYSYRYLSVQETQAMTIQQLQAHPLTDFAPFAG
ncbi:DUF2313 domain-containing protein [Paenibacillus sp. T1]|uniref:DUF2313 domain-containing protein n=1 Tax=Paenibacillus glycinis TaxID=2697035 RepID=A0ABW9XPI8_9BACL|nr:DUF2313 domain-containing protein [Paenibacillus glycinis]